MKLDGCQRFPASSGWASFPCLLDVKNKTERILNIAAWNSRILVYDGTPGGDQSALCGVQVGHKKVEDRTTSIPFFDIKAKCTGLKAHESRTSVSDGKS
jgi:hypothetical protein